MNKYYLPFSFSNFFLDRKSRFDNIIHFINNYLHELCTTIVITNRHTSFEIERRSQSFSWNTYYQPCSFIPNMYSCPFIHTLCHSHFCIYLCNGYMVMLCFPETNYFHYLLQCLSCKKKVARAISIKDIK